MNREIKTPEQLDVNDVFYILYGGEMTKFRVHLRYQDRVFCHSTDWLKADGIVLCPKEIENRNYIYKGRMSKLRAFFMP